MITLEEAIISVREKHPNYRTVGKVFDVDDAWVFSMTPKGEKSFDPYIAVDKNTGKEYRFIIPHQWKRWVNRKEIGYIDDL